MEGGGYSEHHITKVLNYLSGGTQGILSTKFSQSKKGPVSHYVCGDVKCDFGNVSSFLFK